MILLIYCLSIVVLLGFSAFFSGSEIAYSAVNRNRLEAGTGGAVKRALYICDRFDRALSAILIGNNLVNISASSVATLMALMLAGVEAAAARQDLFTSAASVLLTILVLIFGETVPKILARRNPLSFALKVSAPLQLLMTVLTPVTWVICRLVDLITAPLKGEKLDEDEEAEAAEEELIDLIETSEDEGIIDEDQSELLQNALDFAEISVREVMTPRVDMEALEIDDDIEEIRTRIEKSTFSRLPMYDEQRERVIGVLYLNHYYRALLDGPVTDFRSLLIKPCFVYKTTKLPAVLNIMRQQKTHIAIVTDDYGSTIGMVTMEDVLEQIVGDIWDETDEVVKDVVERSEHEYELDGDVTIGEFCELMDWDEDSFETESITVGGWTLEMFGSFPKAGDSFDYENITVTVLEMDDLRVGRVLVTVRPAEEKE